MKVQRSAHLISTAFGYDIHTMKSEGGSYKGRHYKNVSAATMRRFYRLTNGAVNFHSDKQISFGQFLRLFSL